MRWTFAGRDGNARQQRLARHAVVALRIVGRDVPLVAPEDVRRGPGNRRAIRRVRIGEERVEPPRSGAAGEREGEAARTRRRMPARGAPASAAASRARASASSTIEETIAVGRSRRAPARRPSPPGTGRSRRRAGTRGGPGSTPPGRPTWRGGCRSRRSATRERGIRLPSRRMSSGFISSYFAPITSVGTLIFGRSAQRSQSLKLPVTTNSLGPCIVL